MRLTGKPAKKVEFVNLPQVNDLFVFHQRSHGTNNDGTQDIGGHPGKVSCEEEQDKADDPTAHKLGQGSFCACNIQASGGQVGALKAGVEGRARE